MYNTCNPVQRLSLKVSICITTNKLVNEENIDVWFRDNLNLKSIGIKSDRYS